MCKCVHARMPTWMCISTCLPLAAIHPVAESPTTFRCLSWKSLAPPPTPSSSSQQLPAGSVRLEDGSYKLPNGMVLRPDGMMVLPDGSVQLPDGRLILPDGTFATSLPDGSYKLSDGTTLLPDGGMPHAVNGMQHLWHQTPSLKLETDFRCNVQHS